MAGGFTTIALFADIDDFVKAAILFFVVILPIIGKIIKAMTQAPRPQAPNPPRPPAPRPAAAPVRPRAEPLDPVQREVQVFLERAGKQQGGGPRPPEQRPQSPLTARPARPQTAGGSPRPRPKPPAPPQRRPIDATVLEDSPTRLESVGDHVKRHLDSQEFTSRAKQLATVDKATQEIEQHLQSVFDHKLGNLAGPAATSSDAATAKSPPVASAASIAALLRNPATFRQAVILNEILSRPEARWS